MCIRGRTNHENALVCESSMLATVLQNDSHRLVTQSDACLLPRRAAALPPGARCRCMLSVWSDKQQVTHYPVCVCVINSVRRLIQRIQMGITLKRETIMAWDALPIRIKLHTPAQHALISKNRNTGRLLCLVNVAVVSVTKYGSSSCLGTKNRRARPCHHRDHSPCSTLCVHLCIQQSRLCRRTYTHGNQV